MNLFLLLLTLTTDPHLVELQKFQGVWRMEALEVEGVDVPANKLAETTLVIANDKMIHNRKGQKQTGMFQINPKAAEKELDITWLDGQLSDQTIKGIYRLDGDTLKIVRGLSADSPRPRDLGTWPGTGTFMATWKRVNP